MSTREISTRDQARCGREDQRGWGWSAATGSVQQEGVLTGMSVLAIRKNKEETHLHGDHNTPPWYWVIVVAKALLYLLNEFPY